MRRTVFFSPWTFQLINHDVGWGAIVLFHVCKRRTTGILYIARVIIKWYFPFIKILLFPGLIHYISYILNCWCLPLLVSSLFSLKNINFLKKVNILFFQDGLLAFLVSLIDKLLLFIPYANATFFYFILFYVSRSNDFEEQIEYPLYQ